MRGGGGDMEAFYVSDFFHISSVPFNRARGSHIKCVFV
jgi:hypothetical protein